MVGPLEGIKILELAEYIAVPSATAICADWGAFVIKVENPRGGDALRGLTTIEGLSLKEIHVWFEQSNRNKKSIAVDLWKPEGREIVHRLAAQCDVFTTNFTHPVVERFQIDYDTLTRLNPRLIYAHLTGYGKFGPDKDKPGYDFAAFWANSGVMSKLGQPGASPPVQPVGFGDNLTSGCIAGAISAALYAREKTGRGQALDFSLYNYGVWGLSMDLMPVLIFPFTITVYGD
jgi:crotonobetainyl-CoA:carnitine CoA-transferase CaiB-like acyl-CoA transferase